MRSVDIRDEECFRWDYARSFSLDGIIQGWAKEWSLGCVNLRPTARGNQEAGFTQPRDHFFAQPCTVCESRKVCGTVQFLSEREIERTTLHVGLFLPKHFVSRQMWQLVGVGTVGLR